MSFGTRIISEVDEPFPVEIDVIRLRELCQISTRVSDKLRTLLYESPPNLAMSMLESLSMGANV